MRFLAIALFMSLSSLALGRAAKRQAEPTPRETAAQLLVAFQSEKAAEKRIELFQKYNLKEVERVGSTPLFLVNVPEGASLKELQNKLAAEVGVRYAEPNQRMRTFNERGTP